MSTDATVVSALSHGFCPVVSKSVRGRVYFLRSKMRSSGPFKDSTNPFIPSPYTFSIVF